MVSPNASCCPAASCSPHQSFLPLRREGHWPQAGHLASKTCRAGTGRVLPALNSRLSPKSPKHLLSFIAHSPPAPQDAPRQLLEHSFPGRDQSSRSLLSDRRARSPVTLALTTHGTCTRTGRWKTDPLKTTRACGPRILKQTKRPFHVKVKFAPPGDHRRTCRIGRATSGWNHASNILLICSRRGRIRLFKLSNRTKT